MNSNYSLKRSYHTYSDNWKYFCKNRIMTAYSNNRSLFCSSVHTSFSWLVSNSDNRSITRGKTTSIFLTVPAGILSSIWVKTCKTVVIAQDMVGKGIARSVSTSNKTSCWRIVVEYWKQKARRRREWSWSEKWSEKWRVFTAWITREWRRECNGGNGWSDKLANTEDREKREGIWREVTKLWKYVHSGSYQSIKNREATRVR